MRRAHLLLGLVALAAFLGSGQYMDLAHNHLRGLDDATRLLFRSTHIYLLFAALLNLALGLYLVVEQPGWRRWCQRAGSALVLVAPLLLAVGFLTEPWLSGLDRPYSRPAIIGSLVGMGLHLISRWPGRRRRPRAGAAVSAPEEVAR
jgi:ABC-type Fe3+ transport system permease subunit